MERRLKHYACLVGGLLIAASYGYAGTILNYSNFSSTAGLTLTGSATTTGSPAVLRLTPASTNQAGAAYSSSAVTLGANATFSTQFQFQFTNAGGVDPADGMTFVLAASPNGLGGGGGGMGYGGVPNSVAIEFDTYNNGSANSFGFSPLEPDSSNHVAIDTNGTITDTATTNVYGIGSCGFSNGTPAQSPNTAAGCMSNGDIWTANISYDGTSLSVSLLDPAKGFTFNALTNQPINIAALLGTTTAYVGFTSSTGAGWENHDILNWTLANTAAVTTPTPEPTTFLLFGTSLGCALLLRIRKRRA